MASDEGTSNDARLNTQPDHPAESLVHRLITVNGEEISSEVTQAKPSGNFDLNQLDKAPAAQAIRCPCCRVRVRN